MKTWCEMPPVIFPWGSCRVFQKNLADGHLQVFVGREPGGPKGELCWHLSLSHRSNSVFSPAGGPAPGRLPTWEEIKEARYEFCTDSVYMAMILPPKAEYVNLHPTTMHLHEVSGCGPGPKI